MNIDEFELDEIQQDIKKLKRSGGGSSADLTAQLKADVSIINAVTNPKVLDVPTYDSNPNVGHPSVIYIPQGFKGYKYWMAVTPFPDADRENPSIVVSNDGEHWINPPWFSNPISTLASAISDGVSYNSDTEILLMKDGKLGVYWRGYLATPRREVIYLMTLAEDSNVWSPKEIVIDTALNIMSPSIVLEKDKTYSMYSVGGVKVQKRTSIDGKVWSNPTDCILSTGTLITAWHIAVKKVSDGYVLLICNTAIIRALNCYKSTDGINFIGSSIPLIKTSNSGWDNKGYYRSSFLVLEEKPLKLWVFLTGMDGTSAEIWRIGSKIANQVPKYFNRSATNLILSPSLLTGTSGVATDFTKQTDTAITSVFTTDNAQKIEILPGGTEMFGSCCINQIVTIDPLLKYKLSALFKTLGKVSFNCSVSWKNGTNWISTISVSPTGESSDEYDLAETILLTPPATANKATLSFGLKSYTPGDSGSVWIKEAIFTVSS